MGLKKIIVLKVMDYFIGQKRFEGVKLAAFIDFIHGPRALANITPKCQTTITGQTLYQVILMWWSACKI